VYCPLRRPPRSTLFPSTALFRSWASVVAGQGGVILARRFSASGFWDDVRKHDCTAFAYVGELCRYLHERPRQANDSDNKIRVIEIGRDTSELQSRFDLVCRLLLE